MIEWEGLTLQKKYIEVFVQKSNSFIWLNSNFDSGNIGSVFFEEQNDLVSFWGYSANNHTLPGY